MLLMSSPSQSQKHLHGRGEDWAEHHQLFLVTETPPRTWRIQSLSQIIDADRRKHLHGRGEDLLRSEFARALEETPPRTWRRQVPGSLWTRLPRNTSTDVEKTNTEIARKLKIRKHLHGRGEDLGFQLFFLLGQETPPRTWRRPWFSALLFARSGNTSTDVEKTPPTTKVPDTSPETPPRTWRRLLRKGAAHALRGNTSTDVEKTTARPTISFQYSETPPRTWRRPICFNLEIPDLRNTSTDVEKTLQSSPRIRLFWKHLHERGEDNVLGGGARVKLETPPRTWRRRWLLWPTPKMMRNTSTDVEKTPLLTI